MLIQLGSFQFNVDTAAYNEIERISTYSFAQHEVIGSYKRLQAVGVDNERLRLTGTYYAELASIMGNTNDPFEELRELAAAQRPLHLQSADGRNHGYWVIYDINVRGSQYSREGALKASFNIQLLYFGRRVN